MTRYLRDWRTGPVSAHAWRLPSLRRGFSNPRINSCEVRRMATHNLLLLPGDGIGPEVMAEVRRVIDFFNKKGPDRFNSEEALVGGCCYDAHKVAITDATMEKAKAADAIILDRKSVV